MFENRTQIKRNSLAILAAAALSITGIYLSSLFLQLELERKIDMDELLFLPSLTAFFLVGVAIGWLAYFEDVKKIMWNFIGVVLIFGVVFPIIVFVLVSRGNLEESAIANLVVLPGSWLASFIIYKSTNYFEAEHGHLSKINKEKIAKRDLSIEKLNQDFYEN